MSQQPADPPATDGGPGFPRWLKWGLLGALAVLVLGYGAIFLYAKVLNDSPDEFDRTDLDAALAIDDEPAAEPAQEAADEPADDGGEPADDGGEPADDGGEPADEPDATLGGGDAATGGTAPPALEEAPSGEQQVWDIGAGSEVGYRVKEVLFGVDTEAVGRTDQVIGSFIVEGTRVTSGEFIVDVASITSDESRRDNQFRGRIMSTDEFPDAVFNLTEPIELGTEPGDGVEVETIATGELTLRGVTNPVTFTVTAQQQNGRIGVLGSIPVVFADYSIANPSIAGITTEDDGLLEFVLAFDPA